VSPPSQSQTEKEQNAEHRNRHPSKTAAPRPDHRAPATLASLVQDSAGHAAHLPVGEPDRAPADSTPSIKAVWISNDEANHRIAVVGISGLVADPERPRHQRLQHVAFAYSTLDDLLGTYVRLKALGILPAISVDEGSQTAFYYEDPDRNSVELNVSNYAETWASIEHIQNSPEFAHRPLGVDVDPEKLVAAYETGASPWELHKRAWNGDFAPAQPYDPKVLL
jgi:catechol 2,3-dioxygenase